MGRKKRDMEPDEDAERRLDRAAQLAAEEGVTGRAGLGTDAAWVLWEHVTGVMHGKAEDFWLLRDADDARAGCLYGSKSVSSRKSHCSGL